MTTSFLDEEEGELINLTPLLDVLFVILILFMLAAPMLQVDHITLSKGIEKYEALSQNQNVLTIKVSQNNEIMIQGNKVSMEVLPKALKALREKFPTLKPTVYHDRGASFGTYQSLKNALEGAGFDAMDIVLEPV